MHHSLLLLLCIGVGICVGINNRPIIGIYTQPSDPSTKQFGDEFIAASYVKFVESGGARVVPFSFSQSADEVATLFKSINGFLLPGGGVDFGVEHSYWDNLNLVWNLAIEANDNGDYFPIWGTCMGFQELCLVQTQNLSLLSEYNTENYTIPLNFTSYVSQSKLFGNAPQNIIDILANEPVTMNNHMYGVAPSTYANTGALNTFFNVISTNLDRNGREFLSTIESNKYPIYGSQWHPEKPLYEWNIHEVINHDTDSILANAYTTEFFVSEARKSTHQFETVEDETAALIYNYEPIYIYNYINDYEQGYFFPFSNSTSSM
jgi:gamma-glutamyl hydrolase